MAITAAGPARFPLADGATLDVPKMLLVPEASVTLLSVLQLCRNGWDVIFNDSECRGTRGTESFVAPVVDNQYMLLPPTTIAANRTDSSPMSVHSSHGHLNLRALQSLIRSNSVDLQHLPELRKEILSLKRLRCKHCMYGKSVNRSVTKIPAATVEKVLAKISSDICGPFPPSTTGAKYMITFVDHASGYVKPYYLPDRSSLSVLNAIQRYVTLAENLTSNRVKKFQTDHDLSCKNRRVSDYLSVKGILHIFSFPFTPAQNGKVERPNRTCGGGRGDHLEPIWTASLLLGQGR